MVPQVGSNKIPYTYLYLYKGNRKKQKQKKGFDNGRKFGDYIYKGLTVKKHTYLSSNHFRCLKYDEECYPT